MKHTVLFTAFLCVATTFTAKSNDLEAEVFDCNSIHATASVETLDRNYAYILETLISPGIWASREKINIQAYEVDFKELPKGIYRVICLYKGEADVSDLNTQSIIVSPIVKIDFCLSATKVQANNHTNQLLFGKDVMFFPNPANSQIQRMVKREIGRAHV